MNQDDNYRMEYTEINPEMPPMSACQVLISGPQSITDTICSGTEVIVGEDTLREGGQYMIFENGRIILTTIINLTSEDEFCNPKYIYIPNAFTPNNDIYNAVFRPIGAHIANVDMRIYSRWGEKLYEGNGPSSTWNGVYKGTVCQNGAYLYIISVRFDDGELAQFKGTVMLIR